MDEASIQSALEGHIRAACRIDPSDPYFDRKTPLFEEGYLDSVAVEELLEHIAEEFGIEVPERDLMDDAFSNIEGIASIVARVINDRGIT